MDTPEQPSVGQRLRSNFAEGLGITSDEQAKQFFTHPVNTLMQSLEAQGHLAEKAKAAYQNGDYKGALMYGLNYLVPFIGQQTAKAGEQLNEGDYAGGIGRTLGTALPIVAGSPEARGVISDATATVARKAGSVTPKQAAQVVGGTSGAVAGHGTLSPVGAYYGAKTGGSIAEGLLGKERANSPLWDLESKFKNLSDALDKSQQAHADVEDLDATAENKPYAGETMRGRKYPAAAAQSVAQPESAPQPIPSHTPRTVVMDQATGQPEFSDVLAAKQPAAKPAPVFADRPRVASVRAEYSGTQCPGRRRRSATQPHHSRFNRRRWNFAGNELGSRKASLDGERGAEAGSDCWEF